MSDEQFTEDEIVQIMPYLKAWAEARVTPGKKLRNLQDMLKGRVTPGVHPKVIPYERALKEQLDRRLGNIKDEPARATIIQECLDDIEQAMRRGNPG